MQFEYPGLETAAHFVNTLCAIDGEGECLGWCMGANQVACFVLDSIELLRIVGVTVIQVNSILYHDPLYGWKKEGMTRCLLLNWASY